MRDVATTTRTPLRSRVATVTAALAVAAPLGIATPRPAEAAACKGGTGSSATRIYAWVDVTDCGRMGRAWVRCGPKTVVASWVTTRAYAGLLCSPADSPRDAGYGFH